MSRLEHVLAAEERGQRQEAIRTLLVTPLVLAGDDPERFATIARHRGYLKTWFDDQPGWRLVIDTSAGFARLHKVAYRRDATRPARRSDRTPFDRRRYTLLCLALVALDESPTQTTLGQIARRVEEASADDDAIPAFDPGFAAERRAFVDALRLLISLGVLRVRDGDTDRYAQSSEGDALFDVNERLLGQLIAAPIPPAFAASPERILDQQLPETEEGLRQLARYQIFRRLLEDPVLYYDELEPRTYDWLDHSRGFVYRLLDEDAGLPIEKRKEGLAAIDPAGVVTDERFPDGGSTIRHAALLLAALLAGRRDRGTEPLERAELIMLVAGLQADYGERCSWSKQFPADADGAAQLCEQVLALLEAFGLLRRDYDDRWLVRPAIARFAPAAPTFRRGR